MKNPSQEDLLGYVLGALDAQEHADIQHYLDQHPEAEEELLQIKNSLLPLECISEPSGPPIGLARRTCEFIAVLDKHNLEDTEPHATAEAPRYPLPGSELPASATSPSEEPLNIPVSQLAMASEQREQAGLIRSWSRTDLLALVAAIAILAGILFPAVNYARFNSRKIACQNNLRELGGAFLEYASMNPNGSYVAIPDHPKLGVSGSYAVILKQSGLIEDSMVRCQGIASTSRNTIPSVAQVSNAEGEQLRHYHQTMGGDYGYSLGYVENQAYRAPQNIGRPYMVLMADAPSAKMKNRQSMNHGGWGQNCLFADGRVEYIREAIIADDAIYENDHGVIGSGIHQNDNVIAPSHIAPLIFSNQNINTLLH